ncbi:DUF1622 domain-containing protein [[Limnothrix rosea] IAM M-220]|uniref:DUF1622 domain-containing protein n=1 Tax=[Limnothrix rosea] IAM M-220 TaxID=454133 RepID=UPI00095D3C9B|nr:DUF1622 domain-containing protein [[Limnothrix rosea] IAM M-220]OKH19346.1 hypothetical protein NIES208_02180 [[Limnothrix rosea] IAM M-220]
MQVLTLLNIDELDLKFLSAANERLIHGIERLAILDQVVFVIETCLEIAALSIIVLASLRALKHIVIRYAKSRQLIDHHEVVRLEFGLSLALALEFLLAADIAATAVAPSWEALGKLGVVAAIRTFLNVFLEQEVEKLEEKNNRTKWLVRQIRNFGNSASLPPERRRSPENLRQNFKDDDDYR